MSTVGERIALARTDKGLSKKTLGKLVGRSETAVEHWEDGVSGMKFEDAIAVSKALDVSLDWLAGLKE